MELTITTIDEILVAHVSGAVDSKSAGILMDALVQGVRRGGPHLVVDLSGAGSLTRAGVRGLVVAARLLTTAGGAMRICGADTRAEALLRSLGYGHLFKFDRSVRASLVAMSARTARRASGSARARLVA